MKLLPGGLTDVFGPAVEFQPSRELRQTAAFAPQKPNNLALCIIGMRGFASGSRRTRSA